MATGGSEQPAASKRTAGTKKKPAGKQPAAGKPAAGAKPAAIDKIKPAGAKQTAAGEQQRALKRKATAATDEPAVKKRQPAAGKPAAQLKGLARAGEIVNEIIACSPTVALAKFTESDHKMQLKLNKFIDSEREHIHVRPVYLGFVDGFKNEKTLMTSGKMNKAIELAFKDMNARDYKFHPLNDFFEPISSSSTSGYKPKMLACVGGKLEKMYDVDHIVPTRWGGLNHPRNYVVMHRSMNRALGDAMPEDKMAYIDHHNNTVLRKVAEFIDGVVKSKKVRAAIADYIENEMPDWK